MPAVREHLTPKNYVDQLIFYRMDELSLLRLDTNEELNPDEKDSIFRISSLTSPETIIGLPTKNYVDSWHEIRRNRRDLSPVSNDQDIEFDTNNLTKLDSITANRNPNLDNRLANKKHVDDSIGEGNVLRCNQTLQNYLKVSVGDDTYNLTNYDKTQITDTAIIKYPNTGGYLLQNWVVKSNDKNINGKIQNFIKTTKTNNPTGYSVATSLPPIGDSFMYKGTSSNIHDNKVFVSWERTDIIQITNIPFNYNRFFLTNDSLKAMRCFTLQLILEDNTWSTRDNIPENGPYSDTTTDWTLLSSNFTESNYGIKLFYNQIDTAQADMCFSNITITHPVY